ncbi:MAG: methionine--tRNA ligase [Candidatus Pacearchaeota archaeon]|nr:MAG: methionine--tRNA ligase [Candidatus Pacearchaeota archaeon]
MAKKFYITTAIDYVNDEPHIGHAYQKIIADVLARWHRIIDDKVFFLTGTDEHGQKIARSASEKEKEPKEFCDVMSKKFKEAWKALNIEYDKFIRTTDSDHEKFAQEFIKKVDKKGDIYKGKYEGLYCVSCEAFYTEKDLVDGKCPIHKKPVEEVSEETYFFKLSKYKEKLLEHYKKNPIFILPESRRNEIINRVKEELKDLSITRTTLKWGISFPLDKKHVIYVWFEALLNYLSGVQGKDFWPADVHVLGKDNGWFHAVIWPAMLLSAGYELPKTVFVHGFLTFNGEKISKSLGNVISPKVLVKKYGADSVRYFCLRQIPFAEGRDGDFNEKALIERHNNELADKLGNLISRVSALTEKYGLEKEENKLLKDLKLLEIEKYVENFEFDKALNEIFSFIDKCNAYVQKKQPWKTGDKKVLYELVDSIKAIAILLWPFIPETSEKISKTLGFEIKSLGQIKESLEVKKIKKSEILFKKIGLEDGLKKGLKRGELKKGLRNGL